MARWENVLDVQFDLWRWWNAPVGEAFARSFGTTMTKKQFDYIEQGLVNDIRTRKEIEEESYWTENICEMEKAKLLSASPFFVSDDVMTILESAEQTFQPEPLVAEDLIAPVGFAYLPRPFRINDVHNNHLAYRVISWGPIFGDTRDPVTGQLNTNQMGILLSLYSCIHDPEDEQAAAMTKKYADDWQGDDKPSLPHGLILLHVTPWWYGEAHIFDVPGGVGQMVRQFQVFHRIAQQMVASHESRPLPRQYRRRAERTELRVNDAVTVITLRRKKPKSEDPEEREVEWSCRWIVTGHWRNQWYPSLGIHRQKWIGSYVKGPEEKELVIKRRAFEFTR